MSGLSDLVFDIFAIDRASAVFNRVGAAADGTAAKVDKGSAVMGTALLTAGSAALALGVKSVAMAANFDASITRLTTTAGESPKALGMVSQGILDMTSKVGFSAQELANAMYDVESGGFHGAQALTILENAAKGARIEGANVTDVAHALTGALNDYKGTTLTSAEATNAMTAAVGAGMMRFQDLAEALPKIGARAAAAHVTFEEMLAALGTMTKDGLPAAVSATYLGQTIGQLAAPTAKARIEMKGLGIDATAVASTITSGSGHGLSDAIAMLYDGIKNHLVAGGLVSVDTFKKMQNSTTDYQQVLAKLPPTVQTQIQALATMSGGVKAFQGVLMLGGQHADQYASTLDQVTAAVHRGGDQIAGFSEVQKTLAFQFASAKGAASSLAIEIGHDLTPLAHDALTVFTDFMGFLSAHQGTIVTLGEVIAGAAAGLVALKVASLAWMGIQMIGTVVEVGSAIVTLGAAAFGAVGGIEAMGAAAVVAEAPWAPIIAVVGGAAAALALFSHSSHQADQDAAAQKQAIQTLAGTYDQLTGSITKATNAQMLKNASDMAINFNVGGMSFHQQHFNALSTAAAMGINQNDFIAAAQGQASALDMIRGKLKAYEQAGGQSKVMAEALANALGISATEFTGAANSERDAFVAGNNLVAAFKNIKGGADIAHGAIPQSTADVARLAAQYHLTGQEIQTVINAYWQPGMAKAQGVTVQTVQAMEAALQTLPGTFSGIGTNAGQGFYAGLAAEQGAINQLAANIAGGVTQKMREVLQVHSPSRKTQEIGEYVIDGLVIGMTRSQHLAEEASRQIAAAMHKSLMQGLRVEELQLGFDLTAAQAAASKANAEVKAATSWADGFKSNVFTQGFTGTGGPGSSSYTSGGVAFTLTGGPGGTGGIVQQMLAYEQQQATKNKGLFNDISRLRKLGLSAGLIAQMQQGGDAAIPEIQALATATAAQIQQLNSLYNQSNNALQNAGAEAVAGMSMKQLQTYAQRRADTVADIKKAIQGVKLEIADGGKYVRIT